MSTMNSVEAMNSAIKSQQMQVFWEFLCFSSLIDLTQVSTFTQLILLSGNYICPWSFL